MRCLLCVLLLGGCVGSLSATDAALDATADATLDASIDAVVVHPDARELDALVVVPDARELDAGPRCPLGMVAFGTFCMDRYEAPNEPGALPLAMRSALDAEEWCAARGVRLCNEAEWVRACRGTQDWPYPYGELYERGRCNDDETWIAPRWEVLASWPSESAMAEAARLYQGEPSGENEGCESEEGVFDLTGNVAEWVRRSFDNRTNYDHVMKGCYWSGCFGGSPPSCAFVNPAHPSGFRSYEAGFRCCVDLAFSGP